jgi:hypothetical protein
MFSRFISHRLPKFREILPVYAVAAFMVYGWTLITYFRYLHYWQEFLNVGEIFAIFSYAMLLDLMESLLILLSLLLVCAILPPKILKDAFIVRGTLVVICLLGSILFFLSNFSDLNSYMIIAIPWGGATIASVILAAFLAARFRFIASAAIWLSDSMIIFLYIFLPLTLISFFVALIRNLA